MGLNETLVLRGISIMVIILHNFIHRLPGAVIENQHVFHSGRNYELIESVLQRSPDLLLDLISHYGHYGVPVFVFLSGYGLVMKYEQENIQLGFGSYIKRHLGKLWLLLLPLLTLHFFLLSAREPSYFQEHWSDLLLMVGFASNLNPDSYFFHGPWWFFSLIVQLYVVYYVFVYRHTLKPIVILTAVCLCGQIAAIGIVRDPDILEYLRYNFVGSVLPFALGIIAARKKYFPTKGAAIAAFLFFIICCFNAYSWLLTFGLITVGILPVVRLVGLSIGLYSFFKWLRILSAFLFATHPIVRACTFGLSKYSPVLSIVGYTVLSILFAWGYKRLLSWVRQRILSINAI